MVILKRYVALMCMSIKRGTSFSVGKNMAYRLHPLSFGLQQGYFGIISMKHLFKKSSTHLLSTLDHSENGINVDGDWNDGEEEDEHLTNNAEDSDDNDDETVNPTMKKFEHVLSSVKKFLSNAISKQTALRKELEKAKSLEETMHRANLIVSNLWQLPPGTEKLNVQDWENDGKEVELILDSKNYENFKDESDALFTAARKMKRGSAIVSGLLTEVDESIQILQDACLDLEASKDEDDEVVQGRINLVLGRLERTASQTGFLLQPIDESIKELKRPKQKKSYTRSQPTFRKFLSPNGCVVLVGRNRRDNEAICFQVAKGDDLWFHARGCPGAHVLLQVRRGSPRPTEECIQFAANLAAFYSDARTERKADVSQAEPKHIQKPRGAPLGAIKLREELGTVTGYPADVDDELKFAREQSGVIWDEAGSRSQGGKAKNRKKTSQNTQQLITKIRSEKRSKRKRDTTASDGTDFY